jgi:hypothetical protein
LTFVPRAIASSIRENASLERKQTVQVLHARAPFWSAASMHASAERFFPNDVRGSGAIVRRSQRRLSRIAKGLRTRCYSHWRSRG